MILSIGLQFSTYKKNSGKSSSMTAAYPVDRVSFSSSKENTKLINILFLILFPLANAQTLFVGQSQAISFSDIKKQKQTSIYPQQTFFMDK